MQHYTCDSRQAHEQIMAREPEIVMHLVNVLSVTTMAMSEPNA